MKEIFDEIQEKKNSNVYKIEVDMNLNPNDDMLNIRDYYSKWDNVNESGYGLGSPEVWFEYKDGTTIVVTQK